MSEEIAATNCTEPHPPGRRCFDCATDDELAAAIPPFPGSPAVVSGQPAPPPATPGQRAYEAHAAMVVPRPWRWDQLDDKLRAAWDAAAQAAIAAAELTWDADLKAELAEARKVGAEMLDYWWEPWDTGIPEQSQTRAKVDDWRARLGGGHA